MSKRGSARGLDLRWRGVNERLLSGAVSEAFELLDRLWATALPEDLDRLLDFAKSAIMIAAIHERLVPARRWLKKLAAALSSRRLSLSERRKAELHLEAFKVFLPYYVRSRIEVGESFFDRVFAEKRQRPRDDGAGPWSPWLAWFYLSVLMERGRPSRFDAFLRRLPPRANASSLETGLLLVQFGHRLSWTADLTASLRVLRSAIRKLSGTRQSFLHEYFTATTRLVQAWVLTKLGDHEPAQEILESVRREALDWKIHRLHRRCSLFLGNLHRGRGEFAKATEELLGVVPPPAGSSVHGKRRRNRYGEIEQIALLMAAWCAVRAHRVSLAERLLARVENELGSDLDPTPLTWYHIVRGDLLTHHGIAGETNLPAHRAYEEAAEVLHERRAQTENLRPFLLHSLATLACREKDFARAVDYSLDLLDCSPERPDRVGEGLLSQSLLLLHDPGNTRLQAHRERLYEGILSRLEVIRDPETLMRVVSRLYLYTWDETDDLELVDLHLKQLLSLRVQLGDERFSELFRTNVSDPILQRMRRALLGS